MGAVIVLFLVLFKIEEVKCLETRMKHVPQGYYFNSEKSIKISPSNRFLLLLRQTKVLNCRNCKPYCYYIFVSRSRSVSPPYTRRSRSRSPPPPPRRRSRSPPRRDRSRSPPRRDRSPRDRDRRGRH